MAMWDIVDQIDPGTQITEAPQRRHRIFGAMVTSIAKGVLFGAVTAATGFASMTLSRPVYAASLSANVQIMAGGTAQAAPFVPYGKPPGRVKTAACDARIEMDDEIRALPMSVSRGERARGMASGTLIKLRKRA